MIAATLYAALALPLVGSAAGSDDADRPAWPWGLPDAGPGRPSWPWGPSDAAAEPGVDAEAAGSTDSSPPDPCAALQARIERRRAWLAARSEEQLARGGPPNPGKGIPSAVGLYCEAHPDDEDCALSAVAVEVRAQDAVWSPDASFEDYEAHVLAMKRELFECLARSQTRSRR